ncbi:hypothetical protein AQZ52_02635 [Novosphingobium fuchskuhlense]|uniref:DUF1345 domain-containing protein n=1 Tax=Novosphingobium fuchskuhlense TaxID=1117702 RepID=A0A117UWN5_9SPHN|nr:DUF1345 domain-containing protein [Novosphingobium fuchskuhlense]KUR72205.1 hypothetical protein AQZ52_02635 [Novosphingobium fuchskuhlense]
MESGGGTGADQTRRRFGQRFAPPRFVLFLVLLIAGAIIRGWITGFGDIADILVVGFDFAVAGFLLSLIPLLRACDMETMRRHSEENDANRLIVLAVSTLITLVVLAAIAGELPAAKHGEPGALLRLIVTLLLTWLFANVVYALHYAHEYYRASAVPGEDAGGLEFPGSGHPDYLDFAYFSLTLGMTFQTSDVEISSREIRRIVTLHSFAAFVFNIGVIAFTINGIGGI